MDNELGNPEWLNIARSFVVDLGMAKTEEAMKLLSPDVHYRVLGHHALSGEFSGRDEVATHFGAIFTQTEGRFDPVMFGDWMLGVHHVSVLVDVNVQVGQATQLLQHLLLMRFNGENLIDEVTVFFSDPDVAGRVYGHMLRERSE